jgi:hypothetical protein
VPDLTPTETRLASIEGRLITLTWMVELSLVLSAIGLARAFWFLARIH